MARLQDFQTVTPSLSDNLLIVQPQGQGLTALKDIATNNLNGTLGSGSTILGLLTNSSIPKGVYFYQTQNASDNPESGTLTITMIYKANAYGTYSRCYAFAKNKIWYAETGSTVPSALTWSINSSPTRLDITSSVTFNETVSGTSTEIFVKNNVMYIFYQGESKAHSAGDLLFTLPSGYRPSMIKYCTFLSSNGINFITGDVYVNVDGTCKVNQISNTTGVGRIYFTLAYPLG